MIKTLKNLACKALYYVTFRKVCVGLCDNCKL